MTSERVRATVSVALAVEANGKQASISPESLVVDLTDLVRKRNDALARHMMPMRIEQAAGVVARRMLAELALSERTDR